MIRSKENILAKCIDDIKAGKYSIKECFEKYLSIREELKSLLQIALRIEELPNVRPSDAFKAQARLKLMEQINSEKAVIKWPFSRYTYLEKPKIHNRRFSTMKLKMAAIFITVVFTILALGTGTIYAAQNDLPGDVLYPVKRSFERARLIVAFNDIDKAKLYLIYADTRMEEMEALAEAERSEELDTAVNGYDDAMDMAIERIGKVKAGGLEIASVAELVAVATLKHISILDEVYDIILVEARPAIETARAVSIKGNKNALLALAGDNPEKAMEINLDAMEGRLDRARDKAEENDIEEVENALLQFEEFAKFGEEISAIAQGLGKDLTAINELVAKATSIHLEILAIVYEQVPEEAKEAIERAMEESAKGHEKAIEALEKEGVLDKVPDKLQVPETIPEDTTDKQEEETIPSEKDDIPGEIPVQENIKDKIKDKLEEIIPQGRRGF